MIVKNIANELEALAEETAETVATAASQATDTVT